MKTESSFSRVCGWSVRCASVVLALAFCASAFADPSKNMVVSPAQQIAQARAVKFCYVRSVASGVPQPCERFGSSPTTTSPMEIIGRGPEK